MNNWFRQTADIIGTVARKIRLRDIMLVTQNDGIIKVRNDTDTGYATVDAAAYLVNGAVPDTSEKTAIICDEKAANTAGGTSNNATWNARAMNAEVDPDNLVVINSDKMVFIEGEFDYVIEAPVIGATAAQTTARSRLFNVTTATTVKEGQNAFVAVTDGVNTVVRGKFTSNGVDEYRIDTYTNNGRATSGLGLPLNVGGAVERYTYMKITKKA